MKSVYSRDKEDERGDAIQGRVWEWDECLPVPKLPFNVRALLVFCVALACFANSHDGEFVFDDSEAVVNNKDVLPSSPIQDVFLHDFWGSKIASNTSHKSYRPLTILTFRLNHLIAGGLHPAGFHITNIVLHSVTCVLVLAVCSAIFSGSSGVAAPRTSLLCATLFAVHPVHTESVAGIVGRADLLCAICFLLSLLCYVKSLSAGDKDSNSRPITFSHPLFLTSIMFCAVSVFCKEQGVTVIGICSVCDVILHCQINVSQLISPSHPQKAVSINNNHSPQRVTTVSQSWLRPLLIRQFLLLVTGVSILVVRWWVMGSSAPSFQVVDNPQSFVNDTLLRVLNYNYIYAINGWLLLNPLWLCFDWSMGCVPVIESLADVRILAAVAFWVILGSLLNSALKSLDLHCGRLLVVSLASIVVPFLPGANIFFRVGFVVAERVLYLPSIGYCMLVTLGFVQLCKKFKQRQILQLCIGSLILVFMIRSIGRSYEWRQQKTLFDSGAKVCPRNAKVHYNIAKVSDENGNTQLAMEKYRLAIQLNPDYDQAMNNLGNILKELNELDEAEYLLEKAVNIRPTFAAAWMNLGIVQASLNKTKQAEESYWTAIKHRNKYPDCYYNLGNLYVSVQRHQDALDAWMNATQLSPTLEIAWNNALVLMDNLQNLETAEKIASEAIRHVPGNADIYYNLANCYGRASLFEKSEANFIKATQLDPNNAAYFSNLGVLYHRWGKYDEADKAYTTSLKLNPDSQQTISNYAMLKRATKKGR